MTESIDMIDYTYKHKVISCGQKATVYEGINKKNNKKYAFKGYGEQFLNNPAYQSRLSEELNTLWKLKGKENIVQIVSQHYQDGQVFIITEYCQNQTLGLELKKHNKFSQAVAISYIKQIIKGYQSIYQIERVHRNLQPNNIFISGAELKIGDFSDCISIRNSHEISKPINFDQIIGKYCYQPLETLEKRHYSYKSDVYSIGLMFYEMLTGEVPFGGTTSDQIIQKIKEIKLNEIIPKNLSKKSIQFLTKSLEWNANLRMKPQQLITYTFDYIPKLKRLKIFTFEEANSQLFFDKEDIDKQMQIDLQKKTSIESKVENDISYINIQCSYEFNQLTRQQRLNPELISPLEIKSHSRCKQNNQLKTNKIHLINLQDSSNKFFTRKITKMASPHKGKTSVIKQRINKLQEQSKQRINRKKVGPLTGRERSNIKRQLLIHHSTEESLKIGQFLLSQIDFIRFINRLIYRFKKCNYKNETVSLLEQFKALKYKQLQDLSLVSEQHIAVFKESEQCSIIARIIAIYKQKQPNLLPPSSTFDYQLFKQVLNSSIIQLYQSVLSQSATNQNKIRLLDLLIIMKQLTKIIKKGSLSQFHQESNIQSILRGQDCQKVTAAHLIEVVVRLKALKLISI